MKNIYLLLLFASIGAFSQSSYAQPNGTCWTEPTKITLAVIPDNMIDTGDEGFVSQPIGFGKMGTFQLDCSPNPGNKALNYFKAGFGDGADATGQALHLTDSIDANVEIYTGDPRGVGEKVPFSGKLGTGSTKDYPRTEGGYLNSMYGWSGRMYITITKKSVGGAVIIPEGIVLAKVFRSVASGTYASLPSYLVMTSAQILPVRGSCSINNGNTISVPFGDIVYDHLKTSGPSSIIKKDIPLTYSCSSSLTQDIDITLSATPSSFNSKAIKSSIDNVGVVMMFDGKEISPGSSFSSKLVNGQGSDTITFSPIIAEGGPEVQGNFTASATLIMTSA